MSEVPLYKPRISKQVIFSYREGWWYAAHMGRLGQDKPAFGWELEPFWPLLLDQAVSLRV